MINTHKLELLLSRTYFHGSKGVRAIEVLLYIVCNVEAYPNTKKWKIGKEDVECFSVNLILSRLMISMDCSMGKIVLEGLINCLCC